MSPTPPVPLALYVHVPFCVQRCHYCDFAVSRTSMPPVDAWLAALEADLAEWERDLGWVGPVEIDTLYVGGGTPSLLGAEGMARLAALLETRFWWQQDRLEWTAEANPGSLTDETCARWRELGITRLSLGVQSFDDRALEWLGRIHDAAGAARAVERAREAGLTDLSVDLIFGLPERVARDWEEELEQAVALGVTHVSAYGLTAESATPLGRRVAAGREAMPGEDAYEAEFLAASRVLSAHGFEHYEVSNFAKPGHESRHNWHYWIGTSYLGVGPSSHSYVGDERIWNVRSWPAYRRAAEEGSSLRAGRERPDPTMRRLEALWLGLRTRRGIEPPSSEAAARRIRRWTDAGWARIDADGRLRLTPRGWLRMDAIVAELDEPRSRRESEEPEPPCGGAEAR